MKLLRKRSDKVFRMVSISIVAVLFYLSIAPSDQIKTEQHPSLSRTSSAINVFYSYSQEMKTHFLTTYSGSEILNDIESNLFITRYFREFRSLVFRAYHMILPFAGFRLLILCLGYFILRNIQHIPIMAISIGGHAPPALYANMAL